jgi:AraC family transcriptional regulator
VTLYLGEPLRSVQWLEDEIREGQTVRGDVMVKAAGRSHGWKRDEPADVLSMRLDPAFILKVAEENDLDADRVELLDSSGRADPRIEHVGLALLAELEAGGASGRVYAEALATALGAHLLREYAAFPQTDREVRGGLPKWALRAVTELVEDELSRDLSLAEMAGAANLSPYHFSRLFRESTGLPPHRYVISRRVERARALISSTDLPFHAVARAVGFSHQQHLTRHFKRVVGVTPGRFRELASR